MDFGYSYDRLNRLTGCAVADAVYTYAMDEFGNITARTWAAGGGGDLPSSLALVVNRATNRLGGDGYFHDVLGNLVTMPAADGVGTVSMTYLDQGHIGTLTDAAGDIWKYYYDADGKRRIKVKTAGGAATEPDGQGGMRLVADRSYYFYEGENLICQQDIGALVQDESQYEPKFLLLDHLGSTRAELVFDPSTLAPRIQEYYDLMPYGEIITPPTTQESVLFTGKSRDQESGLDYFGARHFSVSICRFNSIDQGPSETRDPQIWNRYTYTRNNPIKFIDPTGNYFVVSAESQQIVAQYVSTLLRNDNGRATVYRIANDPRPTSIDQGHLPRRTLDNGNTMVTNGITIPLSETPTQGGISSLGGTKIVLDQENISFVASATGSSAFSVGLTAFLHELNHAQDMNSASNFINAVRAGAAGDRPTPATGTAEMRAQSVVSELGNLGTNYSSNASSENEARSIINAGTREQQQIVRKQVEDAVQNSMHP